MDLGFQLKSAMKETVTSLESKMALAILPSWRLELSSNRSMTLTCRQTEGNMAPGNWSEDLQEYLTNAWYTTIDRDPFEWSYEKTDTDDSIHEYIGSPVPLSDEEEESENVNSFPVQGGA